jgi:hypothetical protein
VQIVCRALWSPSSWSCEFCCWPCTLPAF